MQISKNFSLAELTFSETAERLQIDNDPGQQEIEELKNLVENTLQPLRDYLDKVIVVNSGFRSRKVNAAVGSKANLSQHTLGQAADIRVVGMDALSVCRAVLESGIPFDQLIFEGTWTHISFNIRGNRRQVLTAHFHRGGPTTYTNGLPK